MTKENSSDNLSPLELAQQEACEPGFCETIWIQKLMKGEMLKEDMLRNSKSQKNLQEPSGKTKPGNIYTVKKVDRCPVLMVDTKVLSTQTMVRSRAVVLVDSLETEIIKTTPFETIFFGNILEFMETAECSIWNVIFGHDRGWNEQE